MKKLLTLLFGALVVFSLAMPVVAQDSTDTTSKPKKEKKEKKHKKSKKEKKDEMK